MWCATGIDDAIEALADELRASIGTSGIGAMTRSHRIRLSGIGAMTRSHRIRRSGIEAMTRSHRIWLGGIEAMTRSHRSGPPAMDR